MIDKLDEIGFIWDAPKGPEREQLIEWNKNYIWVVNFHKAKGHCNVPMQQGNGKVIPAGKWCDEQRSLFMDGKLDQGKIDKLKKVGFDFYGIPDGNDDIAAVQVSSCIFVIFCFVFLARSFLHTIPWQCPTFYLF